MGLSKLFKSKKNKDNDSSIEETVISSDMPYTLGKTVDDDRRQEFKTFTENWIMKTDATGKDVSMVHAADRRSGINPSIRRRRSDSVSQFYRQR